MSELGQLFQQLINLLQDDMTIAYNTSEIYCFILCKTELYFFLLLVSATSLVLYEVIITFPDELRCVWQYVFHCLLRQHKVKVRLDRSQLSFVTALHLSIKYYTVIFLIINSYGERIIAVHINFYKSTLTVAINTNLSARVGPSIFDVQKP